MAISAFSGPLVVYGQSAIPGQEYNPDLGPSLFYAGAGILDPRNPFTYFPGEAQQAQDFLWLGFDNITTNCIVPYTKAVGAIVASANPTGPNLSLVSANSATTGVFITPSITRSDTGAIDTNNGAGLVAIDAYASVTGSITNGILTVTANTAIPLSQGLIIQSVAGAVTSGTAAGTIIGVQLTGGNAGQGVAGTYQTNNSLLNVGSGTITLAWPNPQACTVPFGAPNSVCCWNPQALSARVLAVTTATGGTYATATISGYDIYGYPQVEQITLVAASQVAGKKAWKYVKSVVLSGGTADTTHAYSVDTTDVYGLPIRSDTFGDITVNYATSLTAVTGITAATSYLPSDRTSPATATTGDTRGTYGAFTSSTGANKLIIRQSPGPYQVGFTAGLFGVTPYTNF